MIPFLRSILKGPINHLRLLITDKRYRSWSSIETKYKFYPRHKEIKTTLSGVEFLAPDSASFRSSYKDIFLSEVYKFRTGKTIPVIVDLGANIGLSVIYFKTLFPGAKIVALEPDPKIFAYLEKNITARRLEGVKLLNKAAWKENTSLTFHSTGDDGGRLAPLEGSNAVAVEAMDVSPLLKEKVDFLKIDIEGAEYEILNACRSHLGNVERIALEYHSRAGEEQRLDQILRILREAGFRIHVHPVHTSPHPFLEVDVESGFDLQLDIFAWREDSASLQPPQN